MSKSDEIRNLASQGLPVAEIARRVGVRYQHAYNVLRDAGRLASRSSNVAPIEGAPEPPMESTRALLTTAKLIEGGFQHVADWILVSGDLKPSQALPKRRGVYAFVKDDSALYVGVATMGLAKRLYFYGRPGVTQRTSQRIGAALKAEIEAGATIGIFAASPPDLEWNGLPVAGDAGLELGLIQMFDLPWNLRSSRAV